MKIKSYKTTHEWGSRTIEIEGNELRVKRSSDAWWTRFELTPELRQFLKDI